MIRFNTRFPIKEKVKAKDYTISLGSMFAGESRSVILGLSLRKMDRMLKTQALVKALTHLLPIALSFVEIITRLGKT